ncbi:MAG: 30S ribosomal protein S24e [Candidatus Micrarchaeia archaeon]
MDIQILSDKENVYLKRREVQFSVVSEGPTASKSELLKELCKKLNINPDFAIITKEMQDFGIGKSSGILHAYQSKEDIAKYEPKHIIARSGKKQEGEKKAEGESSKEK